MKRMFALGGIAVMITALALPAFARGPGWGGGPGGRWGGGPGYGCPNYNGYAGANLTDEQRSKLDEVQRAFYDRTAQLRSQILSKRAELQGIMSSPSPDAAKAGALRKDLSDLQGKMAQERLNLNLEERKIDPDARFGGGYGRGAWGGRGPGYGMGSGGRMGGGYGPGACWN